MLQNEYKKSYFADIEFGAGLRFGVCLCNVCHARANRCPDDLGSTDQDSCSPFAHSSSGDGNWYRDEYCHPSKCDSYL